MMMIETTSFAIVRTERFTEGNVFKIVPGRWDVPNECLMSFIFFLWLHCTLDYQQEERCRGWGGWWKFGKLYITGFHPGSQSPNPQKAGHLVLPVVTGRQQGPDPEVRGPRLHGFGGKISPTRGSRWLPGCLHSACRNTLGNPPDRGPGSPQFSLHSDLLKSIEN